MSHAAGSFTTEVLDHKNYVRYADRLERWSERASELFMNCKVDATEAQINILTTSESICSSLSIQLRQKPEDTKRFIVCRDLTKKVRGIALIGIGSEIGLLYLATHPKYLPHPVNNGGTRGVGTHLLSKIARIARAEFSEPTISLASEPSAKGFYRKIGFSRSSTMFSSSYTIFTITGKKLDDLALKTLIPPKPPRKAMKRGRGEPEPGKIGRARA